ncbi:Uncharacterised protein [Mycobacteroides abscessus subsp. abscessus]|nr:Uncharacterised protein [Mycobacteroides abscessus subsp. abscessus]
MHHQGDIVDVNPTGRDIGGHQHPGFAVGECGQVPVACALG